MQINILKVDIKLCNVLAPRVSAVLSLSGTTQVSESDGTVLGYLSSDGLTDREFFLNNFMTSC